MKSIKKLAIFGFMLLTCILIGSCEKPDKEPDLTSVDADYVMPAPTLLTPDQTEIVRQIVAEYSDAVN